MRLVLALLLSFASLPAAAQSAAQKIAQDKEWIAHCVSQFAETNRKRAGLYCRCMAKSVDTSQRLRQTELERSFPPVHRTCFRKAGFRSPD